MHKLTVIIGLGAFLSFVACGPSAQEKTQAESAMAQSTANGFISSSAAAANAKDTNRKFIRTAQLKFKVKSVIKSTYNIENIAIRQGGFVTYTNLTSHISNVTQAAVSADSSLETSYYTVENEIVIRVPNTKLDTSLKEISSNIDFLDYRIIKAEDVALQILSNNLTQQRSEKNEERLTKAIDEQGKKLKETAIAEDALLSKKEQADNAKISNLSLSDQIKFSTIFISIYQRQTIKRELISNDKNIDAYEPGFGTKLFESLKFGWTILESFLVLLTRLWGLFLFAFAVYFIYKWYKQKKIK
jgi:hypothetical protein